MIDMNKGKAEGEVMDLNHGMAFVRPVRISSGSYSDCAGSDLVIITAGASQKPNETRIDLVKKNTTIFKDIVGRIVEFNKDCILLVVTNPVDILTWVTWKLSGFQPDRVIGSGTVLDTARFRYLLGDYAGVDTRNVHGYVIGEHGDTEVPVWSLTNIAGISMNEHFRRNNEGNGDGIRSEIFKNVKNAAYEIIGRKGATYYAVALAVRRIVEAVVRDENSILTVSSLLNGEYGLSGICLSVPTVINSKGIERIIDVPISAEESDLLKRSGEALRQIIGSLEI
jgi:L-lactate dehydrogenase